jgi:Cytochrome domain of cellobiose dehydrogenase
MAMRLIVGALALLATAVRGQNFAAYTEAVSGVEYNLAIPEAAAAPFDVYLSIVAPANITYAAIAFGGCMLRSPLLVAWKNNTNIVASPRWAT